MKTKVISSAKKAQLPDAELLSQVAGRLKGKTLFPHKVEAAKKHLQKLRITTNA